MEFTGEEKHSISLTDASKLTEAYREAEGGEAILGGYFSKSALSAILNQASCIGIRYYYGIDESNNPRIILAGVDGEGDDIYEGELAEIAIQCPPFCPKSNPLNS